MRYLVPALVSLIACLPLLAQHQEKEKAKKNPAFGDPTSIAAGAKLFAGSCAGCHGARGEGGRGPNLRNRGAWHALEEDDLFQTIQKGIPGTDMPATKLPDDQVWQVAAFVRALAAPAIESKVTGDPGAGESLFWGKAGCGGCHRILGRGGLMGPDLSNIGASRPLDQLREAILDPDADGFRGYRGVIAVTSKGRTIEGVARDITNYSVAILDKAGSLHLLTMAEIKQLKFSDHSPMPGDYGKRLSPQELDNLLAYLSLRTVRPYDASTEKKQ